MSTLIISGGRVDVDAMKAYLAEKTFRHIIAVDGGLVAAEALGCRPDYIVGDFDTVSREVLEKYEAMPGVQVRRFVPEKDDTDTQIAIELAISLEQEAKKVYGESAADECCEVLLLGAIGTRMDHTLANICLLEKLMHAGIPAYAVDAHNRISVHKQGFSLKRSVAYGPFLSFLAMTTEVTGITLKGLKYPLDKHTLLQESSLCISNEFAEEDAKVSFESGILMMIEARD